MICLRFCPRFLKTSQMSCKNTHTLDPPRGMQIFCFSAWCWEMWHHTLLFKTSVVKVSCCNFALKTTHLQTEGQNKAQTVRKHSKLESWHCNLFVLLFSLCTFIYNGGGGCGGVNTPEPCRISTEATAISCGCGTKGCLCESVAVGGRKVAAARHNARLLTRSSSYLLRVWKAARIIRAF